MTADKRRDVGVEMTTGEPPTLFARELPGDPEEPSLSNPLLALRSRTSAPAQIFSAIAGRRGRRLQRLPARLGFLLHCHREGDDGTGNTLFIRFSETDWLS